MAQRVLYILLFLCFLGPARAQQNLSFTRIGLESGLGLFSNVIASLHQDPKGYIWVGTGNGLQRFDGNKFIDVAINKPGSDPMPHSLITQIVAMKDGRLMLGFEDYHEIGIFNPADFSYHKSFVQLDSLNWPRGEFTLLRTGGDQVFLNVAGAAVLHYVPVTNSFTNDHFLKLPKGWFPTKLGFFYDALKQQIWMTCCYGICVYDEKSRQLWNRDFNPQHLPLLNHPEAQDCPYVFYIDRQRRTWLFTWGKKDQQLHCFDPTGSRTLQPDTLGLASDVMGYKQYRNVLQTRSGEVWVYGVNTFYHFDKAASRFLYNLNNPSGLERGITCNVVYQVMEDRDGNIWIATDKGLFYTDRNSGNATVINLHLDDRIEILSINDVVEMPDKSLWFAMWGSGIAVLDSNLKETRVPVFRTPYPAGWTHAEKVGVKLLWNICRRKATGKIWVGCNYGIIIQYDPVTRSSVYLTPPELKHSTVTQIIEDDRGVVWIGTNRGDLFKYENDRFTTILHFGSVIQKMKIDRQGWLWISTNNRGIYAFDPVAEKMKQSYTRDADPNSLYLNGGIDIEQLNDSIMVIAAGALNFINKNTLKIRLMRFEDGLPANSATQLHLDNNGYLWIITGNGLCRYNPANNRISTYGGKDGILLAGNTNEASCFTSRGYMVFGGGSSVLLFKPAVFGTTQPPPDVVITDFRLFNQSLPIDSLLNHPEIRLHSDQNSFTIYFSSLSYAQKDRLTYYYKMEGIDKNWLVADQSYLKNYASLPPGHYTFQVYSETIDGQRSKQITQVHIYIRPPFWATKWFITIAVLVVAFIVYAIHTARVGKLLAMEKLRTRVARDLHDDMGSTLSTINILSAMAKTKMGVDEVKTSEYLTKISDNSQRMMEAMDDIVWSIKPSNDSLQKITARMREFATSVLEAKDIEMAFSVEENVAEVKLDMAARRDFFLVFKEAVNNAAKYSKAGKVIIAVSCKNKRLALLVKDDGVGFSTQNEDSGNGLSNMAKRTESMNGKISILSAPGQGTEVRMSIPVA